MIDKEKFKQAADKLGLQPAHGRSGTHSLGEGATSVLHHYAVDEILLTLMDRVAELEGEIQGLRQRVENR